MQLMEMEMEMQAEWNDKCMLVIMTLFVLGSEDAKAKTVTDAKVL